MKRIVSLCLTLAGFGLTFVFNRFEAPDAAVCTDPKLLCKSYILFRPELIFDAYSHAYFMGERVFVALIFLQVWLFDKGFSSACCAVLFAAYVLDYVLFFNDPIPGTSVSFAMFMGGCFILMILREFYLLVWKRSTL